MVYSRAFIELVAASFRPVPLSGTTCAELSFYLGDSLGEYAAGAAQMVWMYGAAKQRQRPTLRNIRRYLERLARGEDPPLWMVVEDLLRFRLRALNPDPAQLTGDDVANVARFALAFLPPVGRGRPSDARIAFGREHLEEHLLALYETVGAGGAASIEAAACASIVLRDSGVASVDADALRRAANRRTRGV